MLRRRWPLIRKHARYLALVIGALLLQAVVLQELPVFGVTLVALPVAAVVIAMRESPVAAGLWGYAIGWLTDAVVPYSAAYHAIALLILCAGIAWICREALKISLPLALLMSMGTLLFLQFFYFILFFYIPARAPLSALPQMVMLTAVLSTPLAVVAYPLTKPHTKDT
jgi:hypothetical protein